MYEVSKQQHTVCEKRTCTQRLNQLARKGLTKILKSERGHNSVKIQFRVMGLGIQGHLMTLNKFLKFHSNSIHAQCLRKELARKGLTKISKSKRGHYSVKIQYRVMVLGIQGHLMTLNKCMKFQSNSTHSV